MLVLQQSGEAEKGKPANQENAARFHATRHLWINVPPVACARPNCALKNGLSRHGALDFDKGRRMTACKIFSIKRPVARTPLLFPPPRVVLKSTGGARIQVQVVPLKRVSGIGTPFAGLCLSAARFLSMRVQGSVKIRYTLYWSIKRRLSVVHLNLAFIILFLKTNRF